MKIEFEELCVREVKEFHKLLLNEINTLPNNIFTLDFTKVEEIDLCAIQLLISLGNYCKSFDIQLQCTNINSTQVIQSIKTYNLDKHLGITL